MTIKASLAAALLIVSCTVNCTQAASQSSNAEDGRTTMRVLDDVAITVDLGYQPDTRTLDVRYLVRNTSSTTAVALFDRGDTHQVSIGRQRLGDIAQPGWREDGGDLEIVHQALPLPNPAPTSPGSPLAVRIAPGVTLPGQFRFTPVVNETPRRIRWCVGVMAFDPAFFDDVPRDSPSGEIWSASFAAAQAQHMACTPWYDVAQQSFER